MLIRQIHEHYDLSLQSRRTDLHTINGKEIIDPAYLTLFNLTLQYF
jgi:hypothetical protein